MKKIRLGRTELQVTKTSFGVLPLQRVEMGEAVKILRKAYDSGINFYDTARAYSDSEEKIGNALSDVRKDIIIASKSHAADPVTLAAHLEASLQKLKTDYIDILQLHNPDGPAIEKLYGAMVKAKEQGKIRFIGITNHKRGVALDAVWSKRFDTLQFPLSYISDMQDLGIIEQCRQDDVGVIAMKALCGGLITNIPAAFAFLAQYDTVVPIWGMQREKELDQLLVLDRNPPVLDEAMQEQMKKDRAEMAGDFCRACGYCLPCAANINITMAARMSLLLRRAPYQQFLEDSWYEQMMKIEKCTECGHCKANCPYELNTPELLKKNLADYKEFYKLHKK